MVFKAMPVPLFFLSHVPCQILSSVPFRLSHIYQYRVYCGSLEYTIQLKNGLYCREITCEIIYCDPLAIPQQHIIHTIFVVF